jgi:amidase
MTDLNAANPVIRAVPKGVSAPTPFPFPEYDRHDGLGLAELVRQGHVTPTELVEAAIARVEAQNPRINAVVTPMFDAARAAAAGPLPQGPFTGVPILVKDLLADCAGVPTGAGNRLLRAIPAPADAEIVRRYRASGAIILGKTNTPEFGLVPYTEPEACGVTRNPWDLARTAGGSSGGSAAAVAARMTPIAAGGDGGGSIRIPASCCGVFGLKPTRGRTPAGPVHGEYWRGFVCEHVLTRSVRDSAAMLDAIAGPDVGAPYVAPPQAHPFLDDTVLEPGRLRIAYTATPFLGRTVSPECVAALESAVRLLRDLGHDVEEAAPPIDREAFSVAFLTIVAAETRADVEAAAERAGRRVSWRDFEASTFALGLVGRALRATDYARASRTLLQAARPTARFFTDFDVLVTPTLAQPPVVSGSLQPSGADRVLIDVVRRLDAAWLLQLAGAVKKLAAETFEFMPCTAVFNVTGQPAMSVPLHWNAAGLPIGIQFVGRFGDESTLFSLAGQLERARPWRDKVPPGI